MALSIGRRPFTIVTEEPTADAMLRQALADHLVGEEAPIAFKIRKPTGRNRLHVLLSSDGFVLARSRHRSAVLAALASHLAALAAGDPDPGFTRFRLRALIGAVGAVLLGPPLGEQPPVVERRLKRLGLRIVDSPFVDLSPSAGMRLSTEVPWPDLRELRPDPGHTGAEPMDQPVTCLLVRFPVDGAARSRAQTVAMLAKSALSGTPSERLDAALSFDTGQPIAVVNAESSSLYETLQRVCA